MRKKAKGKHPFAFLCIFNKKFKNIKNIFDKFH